MTWQSRPGPPPDSGQQPPPDSEQQSPPDLDPSDEEQEEDCDIGQHLELAMKFGEELGHVQTVVEH